MFAFTLQTILSPHFFREKSASLNWNTKYWQLFWCRLTANFFWQSILVLREPLKVWEDVINMILGCGVASRASNEGSQRLLGFLQSVRHYAKLNQPVRPLWRPLRWCPNFTFTSCDFKPLHNLREGWFEALVAFGPDQAMALQRPCFLGSVGCIDMIECRKYINTLDTQHNITNTHSQPAAKLDTAFQNEDIQSTILLLNSQFWN